MYTIVAENFSRFEGNQQIKREKKYNEMDSEIFLFSFLNQEVNLGNLTLQNKFCLRDMNIRAVAITEMQNIIAI